jgi:hypothetical protein
LTIKPLDSTKKWLPSGNPTICHAKWPWT